MSTIEEQLWNYIDGNCDANEKAAIEAKLMVDLHYQKVYQELLLVHQELNAIDLDEPSLSFTRNVMDQVKLEPRPVTLKTKVDTRIIYSIGAFFVLSILGLFGYAISVSHIDFTFQMPKIDFAQDTAKLFNPTFLNIFVLVDVGLALVYLDRYLRRRWAKGVEREA